MKTRSALGPWIIGATLLITACKPDHKIVQAWNQVQGDAANSGQVAGALGLIGPVDASPVAAGEHVFVSTQSGIFTYGLNMNLLAFTPLPGGNSSPAIGPAGEVIVAGTDGKLYRFAGP